MRTAKSSQLLPFLMNDNQAVNLTDRTKIRANFLRKEIEFHHHDIEDLENTLAINKNLINTLITNHKDIADNSKEVLLRLNKENKYLQNTIKLLKSQRDYYHRQCLIYKQIIEDLKAKHTEELNEQRAQISELLENLNHKEYSIQDIQGKFSEVVEVLRKNAKENPIIASLLWKLDIEPVTVKGKITNVVRENKLLVEEVVTLNEKLKRLEDRLSVNTTGCLETREDCKKNYEKAEEILNRVKHRVTNSVKISRKNENDGEGLIDVTLKNDIFQDMSGIYN